MSAFFSPIFLASAIFAIVLLAFAWWLPRYSIAPALVVLLLAMMQLWGMTNAMPRSIVSNIPEGASIQPRQAFYEGAHALAERQNTYAVPVLIVCLISMSLSIWMTGGRNKRAGTQNG